MPDEKILRYENKAIPSSKFPSDHVPLKVEFILNLWIFYKTNKIIIKKQILF